MTSILRMTSDLATRVRTDLRRPHPFALERVGFFSAGAARLNNGGLLILARDYHPVDDDDYVRDSSVGAMMGSSAIRKALEIAYLNKLAMIHVHLHDHRGIPRFSSIDVTESAKFMPNFFHVAPHLPHCALVLSDDRAIGLCWRTKDGRPTYIAEIAEVGAPMRISRGKAL